MHFLTVQLRTQALMVVARYSSEYRGFRLSIILIILCALVFRGTVDLLCKTTH